MHEHEEVLIIEWRGNVSKMGDSNHYTPQGIHIQPCSPLVSHNSTLSLDVLKLQLTNFPSAYIFVGFVVGLWSVSAHAEVLEHLSTPKVQIWRVYQYSCF